MKYLIVMLISMVPLIEQRGAIPVGIISHQLNPIAVMLVSLLGSFIPAPFIFIFFNRIFAWMKTIKQFDWFTNFVDKKVQKGAKKLEKYLELGLITFVGIPLPTTGLWTGSAAAAFMGLSFKKSMFCVFIGGVLSSIVITIISVVAPALILH